MCLQGKQRKWAKNTIRKLGFEKYAKKCENLIWNQFKMEPISAEKEDIKVGNLLK